MKVRIDYTTREVVVLEEGTVFQHSHNIDIVQVAIDKYEPGLVYKMNFTDASGVKNLSRYMEFIGQVDDLYYFKVLLNSTNTAYYGNITMSVSIFTQEVVDEITKTVKIWNSETFSQYINQSEEDDTIDIDSEETTIIDEIYSAIALKLNLTHKGNYKTSALTGITLTNNTANFIANVYNALTITNGFDGVALVVNDSVVISDMPVGAINAKVCIATRDADGAAKLVAHITADGAVGTGDKYYGFMYYSSGDIADAFSGWKKYANNDDLDLKANLTGDNLFNGDQTINGHLAVRTVEIDETLNMTNGKITYLANGANAGDAVNKSQLDLKTDKTYTNSELAKKADLAGGNDFEGNQTINGTINAEGIVVVNATITSQLNKNNTKIVNLANGTENNDAVNKAQTEAKITADIATHDDAESSHEPIRLLIQELDREISRLDGRGVSYGEVPFTTVELQAMDSTALLNAIIAAVEAKSWFEGEYTPNNGDLVYDEGVGDGVNYHEWEYNQDAGAWADNGAISSPKATNDIFGTVKGNSYVSIVAGLMQILLADNATYLKDEGSANKYTYQQIYDAITARYTKTEVDALLDSLKAVFGWESSVLTDTPLTNLQQLSTTEMLNYDMVLFEVYDIATGKTDTRTLSKNQLFSGVKVEFFGGTTVYVSIGATTTTFYEDAKYGLLVTGYKMDGSVHDEMRSVGEEIITYRDDGKVSTVVADTVTTTPTYDKYGNITKITEVYVLDGKTYETTFTYDKFGRISATNKVEV